MQHMFVSNNRHMCGPPGTNQLSSIFDWNLQCLASTVRICFLGSFSSHRYVQICFQNMFMLSTRPHKESTSAPKPTFVGVTNISFFGGNSQVWTHDFLNSEHYNHHSAISGGGAVPFSGGQNFAAGPPPGGAGGTAAWILLAMGWEPETGRTLMWILCTHCIKYKNIHWIWINISLYTCSTCL